MIVLRIVFGVGLLLIAACSMVCGIILMVMRNSYLPFRWVSLPGLSIIVLPLVVTGVLLSIPAAYIRGFSWAGGRILLGV